MSPIAIAAIVVLVVGWGIVSFTSPSPWREAVEWLSAAALYTLLATLFVHLLLRAQEQGNAFAFWAFAFLAGLFGAGLLVTAYRSLAALRGGSGVGNSATN